MIQLQKEDLSFGNPIFLTIGYSCSSTVNNFITTTRLTNPIEAT